MEASGGLMNRAGPASNSLGAKLGVSARMDTKATC
jgi:hypothetical protein